MMTKDEAIFIAYEAQNMKLEELLAAYAKFHNIVENTPDWICGGHVAQDNLAGNGKTANWQRGLHGAIGLVTEAAEIMDAHKKELYGKNKPLNPLNIREECGDVFFYLFLVMDAYGISLKDILQDNVVKLANRYMDKFPA
jgi:NTP pyrophosphatase (non-canonical NTP hydrolase)